MGLLISGDKIFELIPGIIGVLFSDQGIYLFSTKKVWHYHNNLLNKLWSIKQGNLSTLTKINQNLYATTKEGYVYFDGQLTDKIARSILNLNGTPLFFSEENVYYHNGIIKFLGQDLYLKDKKIARLDSRLKKYLGAGCFITEMGQCYKLIDRELVKIGNPDPYIKSIAYAYLKNTLIELREGFIDWFNLEDKSILAWDSKKIDLTKYNVIFSSQDGEDIVLV